MEELITICRILDCEFLNPDEFLIAISISLRANIKESVYQYFDSLPLGLEYLFGDEQLFEFSHSKEKDIPSEESIFSYLYLISDDMKFSIESWILALAYLEKVSSKIPLLGSNWKMLATFSLYNSQRIYEANPVECSKFAKCIPSMQLIDFILINLEFQEVIQDYYEASILELAKTTGLILKNFKADLGIEWKMADECLENIAKRSKENSQINEIEANIYRSERMLCINID